MSENRQYYDIMTYQDIIHEQGLEIDFLNTDDDFLTGDTQIDAGTLAEDIYGTGYVSLSWRSSKQRVLQKGEVIRKVTASGEKQFILGQTYVPSSNGDGTWTYSPKFSSRASTLERVLFWITGQTVEENGNSETIKLLTFYYTGKASGIVSALNSCSPGSVTIDNIEDSVISVSFDGDNIKSAAQKIASALGAQIIVGDDASDLDIIIRDYKAVSEEVYDQLLVLGGTRNMGKRTLQDSEYYSAVTQRLTLPDSYPDSVYPAGEGLAAKTAKTTKILIFDDIFPQMELTIGSVASRHCWMMDENGQKVIDHWEKDGQPVSSDTEGAEPVYKQYTKFYITLMLDGSAWQLNPSSIIAGKPLGILFQSGVLMGREFDLAFFDIATTEHMEDDVDDAGYTAAAGSYRIIMQADGSTLLPNDLLAPATGDKVTLTGVALDDSYRQAARLRLLERAKEVAPTYMNSSETEAEYSEEEDSDDFLIDGAVLPGTPVRRLMAAGASGAGSSVVTCTKTDLVTGRRTITTGTFRPQGLLSSMVQKVDGVSLSGGSATMGSVDVYTRNTAPIGIDQFNALRGAGGGLGMVTVNRRIDSNESTINSLRETLDAVEEQSDRSFDIWFGEGTPSPLITDPTATPNFPAIDWDNDEDKEKHLQDVYYDINRSAGATGGRSWRWVRMEVESEAPENEEESLEPTYVYGWDEITDGDTLASLQQIADLSNDNILTPSEKLVAARQWADIIDEKDDLLGQAGDAKVPTDDYLTAYYALFSYLNRDENALTIEQAYRKLLEGGSTNISEARTLLIGIEDPCEEVTDAIGYIDNGKTGDAIDALRSLMAYGVSMPVMLAEIGNSVIEGAKYQQLWTAYRGAKTALMTALSEKSLAKLDDMASDGVLTDIEKLAVIREYERMVEETVELIARASEAGLDTDSGSVQYQYRDAYSALYAYLDNLTTAAYTVFSGDLSEESSPTMLYNGEDSQITGATFTGLWSAYYAAAAALRQAIQSKGVRVFATNYQSVPPNPVPPYKVGDLWIHTDSNGNSTLRICVAAKTDTQDYSASDWVENSIYSDPRSVLAALADLFYQEYGGGDTSSATITLSNGSGSASPTITGATPAMYSTLSTMIGDAQFTISCGNNAASGTPNKYSCYCQKVGFTIPGSNEIIYGGCQISMYNGDGWEVIQNSTSSLLKNLGNAINAVVFGSNAGATEAAGLTVGQRFAKMFAEAQVWDETANDYVNLSSAVFGLSIEKVNGKYVSTAKLQADKIDFNAGTFQIGADHIAFSGKTVEINSNETLTFTAGNTASGNVLGKIVFNGIDIDFSAAETINLNAKTINLNADKINWKKENVEGGFSGDVIPGDNSVSGYTPAIHSHFYVDEQGNVTMNNLTANNGTFTGTMKTLSGRVVVEDSEISTYKWYGIAGLINPEAGTADAFTFGVRDYKETNFYDTRLFMGTNVNNLNIVVGLNSSGEAVAKMVMRAGNKNITVDGTTSSISAENIEASSLLTGAKLNVTGDVTLPGILLKTASNSVTLPSSPEVGQVVIVRGTSANDVRVSAPGEYKILDTNGAGDHQYIGIYSRTAAFIYLGTTSKVWAPLIGY